MTRSVLLAGLLCLVCAGCASTGGEPRTPTVSWEEAIDIIKTGKVETVVQYHSRVVTLVMKDGSNFETREPRIDLVFGVIEECGAPCANVGMITE